MHVCMYVCMYTVLHVTKEPWAADINHELTNKNQGLSFLARFKMYDKRKCKYLNTKETLNLTSKRFHTFEFNW